jgi:hypothetical protein
MSRGTQELAEILEPYVSIEETLSLLSLHLYEVFAGTQKYSQLYEALFSLPTDSMSRREALAEILSKVMVLMEDVVFHARGLREQADKALDEVDRDDEGSVTLST